MVLYDRASLGADIYLYWTTQFMLDFCKAKIIALLMHIVGILTALMILYVVVGQHRRYIWKKKDSTGISDLFCYNYC